MYQQKGSMGARIGALFLDGLFLWLIWGLVYLLAPDLFFYVVAFGTFLYYGIFEGGPMHASPGKYICGLIVVDENFQPITYAKSFLRSLGRWISSIILGIGFLIGLFDNEGKALHDKIAGTFVAARTQPSPIAPQRPQPTPQPPARQAATPYNPQLIGVSGHFAGQSFPIGAQGILMGRDSTACDFVFPDRSQGISRSHCKVQFNPQTQMFILYDLGSTYGTFLGSNVRVPQGQPMALRPGDEFYLASRMNLFRVSL